MSVIVGKNDDSKGKIWAMVHTQFQLKRHPLNGVSGQINKK
jgi:hypothetical protein